jgi:hypothetical protein
MNAADNGTLGLVIDQVSERRFATTRSVVRLPARCKRWQFAALNEADRGSLNAASTEFFTRRRDACDGNRVLEAEPDTPRTRSEVERDLGS